MHWGQWKLREQLAVLLGTEEAWRGRGRPLFPLVIPSSCCQPTRKDPSLGPQSRGNFSILLGCLYHENTLLPGSKSQSWPRKSQALICGPPERVSLRASSKPGLSISTLQATLLATSRRAALLCPLRQRRKTSRTACPGQGRVNAKLQRQGEKPSHGSRGAQGLS